MNEQFLDFVGLREDPFDVSPNPRFYYPTPAHDTALAELMNAAGRHSYTPDMKARDPRNKPNIYSLQWLNELWNCNTYLRRMLDRARSSCDRDGVIQRWRRVAVSSPAPSLQGDGNDESAAHQPELATPQFRLVPRKAHSN